ncbi:MAG: hypothetical protein AAGB22_04690, partial [Bacteroidota bacterium]
VLASLGVEPGEKFTIFRFVSWEAHHDVGHRGLTNEAKIRIVQACAEFGKVFISSEMALPEALQPYQLQLPVDQVHHAMAFASLLYGESATMASECAVLGTPAIFLDDTGRGYNKEQEEQYGLVSNFTNAPEDQERSLERALEILRLPDPKAEWLRKRDRMLADKLDVTAFLVWFAEAYPESIAAARAGDSLKERFSARPAGRE